MHTKHGYTPQPPPTYVGLTSCIKFTDVYPNGSFSRCCAARLPGDPSERDSHGSQGR